MRVTHIDIIMVTRYEQHPHSCVLPPPPGRFGSAGRPVRGTLGFGIHDDLLNGCPILTRGTGDLPY